MNSQGIFCPNSACPASGHVGQGNIWIHDRRRARYRCTVCGRTFTEKTGTPLAHKRTATATIVLVVTLIAHGCPIAAIEAAFGLDRRTVRRWLRDSGAHAERIHQHLVLQPRDLGLVEADEVRLKLQGAVVWLAMAIMTSTHLWLGGVVRPQRDLTLITSLLSLVKAAALRTKRLVLVTDGLAHYRRAAAQVFRAARQRTGQRGRPRLRAWPGMVLVQVVKMSRRNVWQPFSRTALRLGKRIAWVVRRTRGCVVASTAAIERFNGTLRERCAAMARRTRHLSRQLRTAQTTMYLMGTVYNFGTVQRSLQQQTPAMAAGITDHVWSVGALLGYRIPPPPWQPPKRRGRRSKRELALMERWRR